MTSSALPGACRGRPRRASFSISAASNRLPRPSGARLRTSTPRLTYAYSVARLIPSRSAASSAVIQDAITHLRPGPNPVDGTSTGLEHTQRHIDPAVVATARGAGLGPFGYVDF